MKHWLLLLKFVRFNRVHRSSLETIRVWQQAELRRLLAYLSRHTKMYASIFAERSLTLSDVTSLEILHRLPVLSKDDFRSRPFDEYVDHSQSIRGSLANTSGTSGKPFRFVRSEIVTLPYFGDALRFRFLMGQRPWRFDLGWLRVARVKVRGGGSAQRLALTVEEYLADEAGSLERMAKLRPHVIESYASILYAMAEYIQKQGAPAGLKPRYAIASGEMLSVSMRTTIESVLGCEVFNRYGVEEFGAVATECAQHDGMHVHSETFIVEVLDRAGVPLREGEEGRIVITDLYNYRMPFVRYDTGDHGRISFEKCRCGMETPRLWLEGRYSAYLTFGGRRFHHLEFDAALDRFMNGIAQYQVAKVTQDMLEIRIIPSPAWSEEVCSEVIQSVQELVGVDIAIRAAVVSELSRTGRGKSQIVVNEGEKESI